MEASIGHPNCLAGLYREVGGIDAIRELMVKARLHYVTYTTELVLSNYKPTN